MSLPSETPPERGTRSHPTYVRILESSRANSTLGIDLVFAFIGVGIIHHFLPKFHIHMTYWDTFWTCVGLSLVFGNNNITNKLTERTKD